MSDKPLFLKIAKQIVHPTDVNDALSIIREIQEHYSYCFINMIDIPDHSFLDINFKSAFSYVAGFVEATKS